MMRKAFIFTPAVLGLMLGIWWVAKGVAPWDVGATLVYTVAICATVYGLSYITSTAAFMFFAIMTLAGEIYYLLNQFHAGNISQQTLIYLLIAIIIALMAERGN